MKRKQKKKTGDKITGCLEPFEVDDLQKPFLSIINSQTVIAEELLSIFRENSKISIALRMRQAVDMYHLHEVISKESQDIITKHLKVNQHGTDAAFVSCTLQYFSGQKTHNLSLNLKCACCNSKDPEKALAHARTDCYKFSRVYAGKILKKLQNRTWHNLSDDINKEWCIHFQSIDYSVKFVCKYLTKLCKGKLPRELDAITFNNACIYDTSLALHYTYDVGLGTYKLNARYNHLMSSIKQECATYIFCMTLK